MWFQALEFSVSGTVAGYIFFAVERERGTYSLRLLDSQRGGRVAMHSLQQNFYDMPPARIGHDCIKKGRNDGTSSEKWSSKRGGRAAMRSSAGTLRLGPHCGLRTSRYDFQIENDVMGRRAAAVQAHGHKTAQQGQKVVRLVGR